MPGLQNAKLSLSFGVDDIDDTIDDTIKIYSWPALKSKTLP
jgi:aminodeoxyfutalosine synthase